MRPAAISAVLWLLLCSAVSFLPAKEPERASGTNKTATDTRLGKPKDFNGYFPFHPPASLTEWQLRRKALREQVLVATGLWPMPDPAPLDAVIHSPIDRDAYTVEKVFFRSYPGHYVSGNLYRPKGKGKKPGVLCPHGHWKDGRLEEFSEKEAVAQVKQGGEKYLASARFHLQARCAQLARMGCVVFHYDMVGYADSHPIKHREGFTDTEAELRLQSFMGLQTYNSIRALDFLLSLPDVDTSRIGVTGASGGGTQTFILGAIDDRPTVAFPAVMVSTGMQGGCVCENCSYLRQDTGNVELAGLFAPKPLGMSGANDWTLEIETKGLPELKALYRLYNAEDRVMAKCFPQFGHNYNQVSRELMYDWFNRHLHLGQAEPVVEPPFTPVSPRELSVFDDDHPRPPDTADAPALRRTLTALADDQLQRLAPKDEHGLRAFRETLGTAFRVMLHDQMPAAGSIEAKDVGRTPSETARIQRYVLSRRGRGENFPVSQLSLPGSNRSILIWVHPNGKSSLVEGRKIGALGRSLLEKGVTILVPDLFLTGETASAERPPVDPKFAGFTYGYNPPLLANRVHDLLTVVAFAKQTAPGVPIDIVGFDKAGPWALLGRALCGDAVRRTAVDLAHFDFSKVARTDDEMMLPGALKYGGLAAAAGLSAPAELFIHNAGPEGLGSLARQAYQAARASDRLTCLPEKTNAKAVLAWAVRGNPEPAVPPSGR